MTAKTIRNIHSILSGAFATAKRWEWIAWNPAESAKPPAITRRPLSATTPEDVAKVIAEGHKAHPVLALYLWLAAITGARRGELCALQVHDVNLVNGSPPYSFQLRRGRWPPGPEGHQDAPGPVPGYRSGDLRDDQRAPG